MPNFDFQSVAQAIGFNAGAVGLVIFSLYFTFKQFPKIPSRAKLWFNVGYSIGVAFLQMLMGAFNLYNVPYQVVGLFAFSYAFYDQVIKRFIGSPNDGITVNDSKTVGPNAKTGNPSA